VPDRPQGWGHGPGLGIYVSSRMEERSPACLGGQRCESAIKASNAQQGRRLTAAAVPRAALQKQEDPQVQGVLQLRDWAGLEGRRGPLLPARRRAPPHQSPLPCRRCQQVGGGPPPNTPPRPPPRSPPAATRCCW
jgi:hypothetical protein